VVKKRSKRYNFIDEFDFHDGYNLLDHNLLESFSHDMERFNRDMADYSRKVVFGPIPNLPPIPPKPPVPHFSPANPNAKIVKKEERMSHNLWICTPKDTEIIDHICAKIVGMGVKISALAQNGNIYQDKQSSPTTIIAIKIHNFNSKLGIGDVLSRIKNKIKDHPYYGIVLVNTRTNKCIWGAGNVEDWDMHAPDDRWEVGLDIPPAKAEVEKSEPEPQKNEPKKDPVGDIDMSLLLRVLKASTAISDVFFDNVSQNERRKLYEKVETLATGPNHSLGNIVPKVQTPESGAAVKNKYKVLEEEKKKVIEVPLQTPHTSMFGTFRRTE